MAGGNLSYFRLCITGLNKTEIDQHKEILYWLDFSLTNISVHVFLFFGKKKAMSDVKVVLPNFEVR